MIAVAKSVLSRALKPRSKTVRAVCWSEAQVCLASKRQIKLDLLTPALSEPPVCILHAYPSWREPHRASPPICVRPVLPGFRARHQDAESVLQVDCMRCDCPGGHVCFMGAANMAVARVCSIWRNTGAEFNWLDSQSWGHNGGQSNAPALCSTLSWQTLSHGLMWLTA